MTRKLYLLFLLVISVFISVSFKRCLTQQVVKKIHLPQTARIVCLGDSLTSGVGASAGEDYPSQLANILNVEVKNAGVSGDTTSSALNRLNKDVLSQKADLVIILLGGNDLIHRVPLENTKRNIETIVARLKEEDIFVVLVSPVGYYDKVYKEVAKKYDITFIPHILRGILYNPDLMSDEIHPNSHGYRIIAERIAKVFKVF